MDIKDSSIGVYLGQVEFVIPAYQRPYQWTNDLLEGLWSDLGEMYVGSNPKRHYLGVLLGARELNASSAVRGKQATTYGRNVWALVDGQQRLVTLLLLLAALRDAGTPAVKRDATALMTVDEPARPRLLGQEEDRELLGRILLTSNVSLSRSEAKTTVGNAYAFFTRQLAAGTTSFWKPVPVGYASSRAPRGKEIKPAQLLRIVRERLHVTDMMLNQEDQSAPAVFDAINGKRRELEPVDLLRNTVFAELNDIQLFTSTWATMESECRQVKLGGARLGTLPLFIDSYLHSLGEGASQYRLARRLNELILEHAPMNLGADARRRKVRGVIKELVTSFDDFKVAQSSAFDGHGSTYKPAAVRALDNISMLSSGPPLPLSLLLLRYRRTNFISDAQLYDSVRVLESYLGRRIVAGEKQQLLRSHLNSVTAKVIKEFGNASTIAKKMGAGRPRTLAEILARYLNTPGMPMPSDPVLVSAVMDRVDMNKLSARQKFAVLRRLNDEVAGRHIPDIHLSRHDKTRMDYSIEHVFPDSFRDRASITQDWKDQLRDWGQVAGDVDELVGLRNNLGNLTLVHQNSALGRRAFLDKGRKHGKRRILKDRAPDVSNSVVYAIRGGVNSDRGRWTATDVRERAVFLAQTMKTAYPKS
ncbi:hypothetical protein ASD62_05735 [Phycicoccus sp. Root563]|uniref:DUF262 domain-containing protein n=1 Tax=Phycicoccus sp. Root563 TaxID=1736562 RepID=UPI0007034672|nr:DUF262 domain-containing HNH endonuclease family protein [Phycicoccus sp. Root563]KQZ88877.1 hypothetical protein ASD62_05735 [Phycicoccus sp. Root563]